MSLWLMPILVVVSAASTWAQEIPGTSTAATGFSGGSKVRLTREQTAVFQDALQTLAQQGHVTVVAEGAPLHPTLPAKDIPDLSQDPPRTAPFKGWRMPTITMFSFITAFTGSRSATRTPTTCRE